MHTGQIGKTIKQINDFQSISQPEHRFTLDPLGECFHVPLVLEKTIFTLLVTFWAVLGSAAEPERSVIQILNFSQQPLWDTPWRFGPVNRSGGSGFVVKGKRIMTNAHVVSWARQILVQKYQDPRPYVAEVEFIGHDCDLALLKVQDERFFENLQALELGELPKVRSTVVTYGYPAGGEEISYTRGVVSRIQMQPYTHIGNRQLLGVQTDAAINPGNSGGPVIQDDKVVGVAFQGIAGLENTGFFIPTPIVEHFFRDIENGKYEGFPLAGVRVVPLESPAYRAFLKLPNEDVGMRVDGFAPLSGADKYLHLDDVVLKIGAYPIASDGTILYHDNRVSAALAFQLAQNGEKLPLQVWREGAPISVDLPVRVYDVDRTAGHQNDTLPRYYIYGGLVFTPLSYDYLRGFGSSQAEMPSDLLYELYYRRYETPDQARTEPIVLASVLADEVNANVSARGRMLVDQINGVRIDKLEDVIRAFETSTNQFDRLEFGPSRTVECLEHALVDKAGLRILKNYGIASDRRL